MCFCTTSNKLKVLCELYDIYFYEFYYKLYEYHVRINVILEDYAFIFPCEFATCEKLTCNVINIKKLKF